MFSVRRQMLNENEPEILSLAIDSAQGVVLSTIFGALKPIMAAGINVYLFPLLTLLNIYKNYKNYKNYRREVNKSLEKKASIGMDFLSLVAELTAVTISSISVCVTFSLAATLAPAIFLGITAVNFVSSVIKTVYHGLKWICGESGTKKNDAHKAEFKKNAIATCVLGVMGAALGILFFAPAFNLVVWSASVGIAAQATAATVFGGNALMGGYLAYNIRKNQKQQSQNRQQTILANALCSNDPVRDRIFTIETEESLSKPVFKSAFSSKKEDELREKYKNNKRFENVKNNHVDDLARQLEVSDDKKVAMLNMIQQVIKALSIDLGIIRVKGKKCGEIDLKGGELPPLTDIEFRPRLFDPQKQKRLDKLQAALLLKEFVEERTSLKDEFGQPIKHVGQIMKYLNDTKKLDNVFKSAFATDTNHGGMQKLFVVTEHYDALRMNDLGNNGLRRSSAAAA